jgi:twitching motility two-component system response regulator PilH
MLKVLLIDDSRFTRKNVSEYLATKGYKIVEAENGISGLDVIEAQKLDLIITDLLMPEMDGYIFLEELSNRNIHIPVIVMTADIQETTKKRVMDLGAFAIINKPPDYIQLIKLIKSLTNE